jgi:diacylglycerol kinase (CTP)
MMNANSGTKIQAPGHFITDYKKRSDVHLARKIWHVTTVFLMFMCWHFFPFWICMSLLIIGWIAFVPADIIRLKNPELNSKIAKSFKLIMRQNELDRLAGTTYLITGTILIAALFSKPIVALSLLFLAFADPIASYVGIRFGKDKIFGHKSVQGFMAAFVVCAVIAYTFLYLQNVNEYILIVSLLAGLVGALAELIPVAKLDDNFTMPVLSSIGLSIIFYLFNIYFY